MRSLVFISYSHTDKPFVRRVTRQLESIGVEFFLDEKDIPWGNTITEDVQKALGECIAILVIISAGSLSSQWVSFEIGHAMGANFMGANKKVLPLLTHPSLDLPAYLADRNYFTDIKSAAKFFKSDAWLNHCEVRDSRPHARTETDAAGETPPELEYYADSTSGFGRYVGKDVSIESNYLARGFYGRLVRVTDQGGDKELLCIISEDGDEQYVSSDVIDQFITY